LQSDELPEARNPRCDDCGTGCRYRGHFKANSSGGEHDAKKQKRAKNVGGKKSDDCPGVCPADPVLNIHQTVERQAEQDQRTWDQIVVFDPVSIESQDGKTDDGQAR